MIPVLLVHTEALAVDVYAPSEAVAIQRATAYAQTFPGFPLNRDEWSVSTNIPSNLPGYEAWKVTTDAYPKAVDDPQFHGPLNLVSWARTINVQSPGDTLYHETITYQSSFLWFYSASSSTDAAAHAKAEWIDGGFNEAGRVGSDGTVTHTPKRWIAFLASGVSRTVTVR